MELLRVRVQPESVAGGAQAHQLLCAQCKVAPERPELSCGSSCTPVHARRKEAPRVHWRRSIGPASGTVCLSAAVSGCFSTPSVWRVPLLRLLSRLLLVLDCERETGGRLGPIERLQKAEQVDDGRASSKG